VIYLFILCLFGCQTTDNYLLYYQWKILIPVDSPGKSNWPVIRNLRLLWLRSSILATSEGLILRRSDISLGLTPKSSSSIASLSLFITAAVRSLYLLLLVVALLVQCPMCWYYSSLNTGNYLRNRFLGKTLNVFVAAMKVPPAVEIYFLTIIDFVMVNWSLTVPSSLA
jgi:hypothetical protein